MSWTTALQYNLLIVGVANPYDGWHGSCISPRQQEQ